MPPFTERSVARPALALAAGLLAISPLAAVAMERSVPLVRTDATLSGEDASMTVPLDLPRAMPLLGAVLTLGYSNALAVQPDRSVLDVALNGQPIARLPLNAAQGASAVEIVIPPPAFASGGNLLSLAVRQEHRLGCDRASFDELTTTILADRSKLVLDLGPLPAGLGETDIENLLAASFFDGEVVTVASARPAGDARMLAWGGWIAEGLALRRGQRSTPVEAVSLAGTADLANALARHAGSNLVLVGTLADLGPLLTESELAAARAGRPVLRLLPADAVHLAVMMTGVDDAAVEQVVAAFRDAAPGGEAGKRPTPQRGDSAPSFADLGVETRELTLGFTGTVAVPLDLPDTFYGGDGQSVRLKLNYAYAAGLAPSSALIVRVNGVSANMLRLDRSGGAVVVGRDVALSMKFLRPGLNTIELQPLLDLEQGLACPGDVPMLSVFDDSRLEIPPFASVARGGDLRSLAAMAYPYAGTPSTSDAMAVLGDDPATMGAAWSLRGRLAQRHGAPLNDLRMLAALPGDGSNVLAVGATSALPDSLLAHLPMAWPHRAAATKDTAVASAENTPATPAAAIAEAPAGMARARWSQRLLVEHPEKQGTWLDQLISMVASAASADPSEQPAKATLPAATAPETASATVLLSMRAPWQADRNLTLLTAASPALLAAGTDRLLDEAIWGELEGDYATWEPSSTVPYTERRAEPFVIAPVDTSLHQIYLIALTFLSYHPVLWIASMLSALLFLSLVTSWALGRVRVR